MKVGEVYVEEFWDAEVGIVQQRKMRVVAVEEDPENPTVTVVRAEPVG